MKVTGKISVKPFAAGSKSERNAVFIETDQGAFVLERMNENPFERSPLMDWDGQNVAAEGELINYLFLAKEVKKI